jgi:virginiamycin B lyase
MVLPALLEPVAALADAPGAIAEFSIPTASAGGGEITAGPDGALWFTEQSANKIGRVTTAGVITEFAVPTAGSSPTAIVAGPDGNLWFTENTGNQIGRITTTGTITEFAIPTANSQPYAITVGSHGGLWFVEQAGNKIGKISPVDGSFAEFPIPTANSMPLGIRTGADGALWFTESASNKIGRLANGVFTEYLNPNSAASLRLISPASDGKLLFTEANVDEVGAIGLDGSFKGDAAPPTSAPGLGYIGLGPDAGVWFTEQKGNKIGRVSTNGFGSGGVTFEEFPIPTASSGVVSLTPGADGNLWFVEQAANKIGRLTVPANGSPLYGSVLPASRSIVSGNTATAFAAMVNAGTTSLDNCKILPLSDIPITFNYQTTNPATNINTGTANTPVTIAAGALQTFVISLTANTTFAPTNVILSFSCKNVEAAQPLIGVNSFLLASSATQTPDVVALSATATSDGIVNIPGTSGTGAFAIATVNVGTGGPIIAFLDTGSATVNATFTLCQTNPTTGACIFPPTETYGPIIINANDTPTFSVFVTATGPIPFAPATNRVFVRFKDSQTRATFGSTSVAVRTQ